MQNKFVQTTFPTTMWRGSLAVVAVQLPKLFTSFIWPEIMHLFIELVEAPLCWRTIN